MLIFDPPAGDPMNYEKNHSHYHCWAQKQPSACGIALEKHTQCCLCNTPTPQPELSRYCGAEDKEEYKDKVCPHCKLKFLGVGTDSTCPECGTKFAIVFEPQKEEGKCTCGAEEANGEVAPFSNSIHAKECKILSPQDEDWEEELQVEVMEDYINCIEETVGMGHQLYSLKVGKRREHWEKLKSFIKSLINKEYNRGWQDRLMVDNMHRKRHEEARQDAFKEVLEKLEKEHPSLINKEVLINIITSLSQKSHE